MSTVKAFCSMQPVETARHESFILLYLHMPLLLVLLFSSSHPQSLPQFPPSPLPTLASTGIAVVHWYCVHVRVDFVLPLRFISFYSTHSWRAPTVPVTICAGRVRNWVGWSRWGSGSSLRQWAIRHLISDLECTWNLNFIFQNLFLTSSNSTCRDMCAESESWVWASGSSLRQWATWPLIKNSESQ